MGTDFLNTDGHRLNIFTPLESPAIYGGVDKISIPYRKGGGKAPFFLTGFIRQGILICILLVEVIFPFLVSAEVYITAEEAIQKIFPASQKYKIDRRIIDNQEFRIFTVFKGEKILGWAVVVDALGKIKPITFLVGIDNHGKVLDVCILEYRDIFGSEIKRKSFLRQFRGKSIKDTLSVGRDIDAVTGATISSRAATSVVKKSLKVIDGLQKNLTH